MGRLSTGGPAGGHRAPARVSPASDASQITGYTDSPTTASATSSWKPCRRRPAQRAAGHLRHVAVAAARDHRPGAPDCVRQRRQPDAGPRRRPRARVRRAAGDRCVARRLIGQLLTESVVLAVAGAGLALGVSTVLSRALVGALSSEMRQITLPLTTDWRVFASRRLRERRPRAVRHAAGVPRHPRGAGRRHEERRPRIHRRPRTLRAAAAARRRPIAVSLVLSSAPCCSSAASTS